MPKPIKARIDPNVKHWRDLAPLFEQLRASKDFNASMCFMSEHVLPALPLVCDDCGKQHGQTELGWDELEFQLRKDGGAGEYVMRRPCAKCRPELYEDEDDEEGE